LKASRAPHEKSYRAASLFDNAGHPWVGAIGLAVAVGIAYFMAARFGLAFRAKPGGVAVFWPAAGIAIGALIALGPDARLPVAAAVAIATITSKLLITGNLWLGIIFGVVCAGQTLLTAWLVEHWFGRAFKLEDVPQVLGFLVASAVGAAMAAVGAVAAVSLVHSAASPLDVWRLWFASCLLGTVTVAPLLIGLGEAVRELPPRRELIEGTVGVVTLAALSAFLISLPQWSWATALPVALVFPLLLWIAVRCRPVFAAAAAFVVALAVIWSATFNMGHFGDASIPLADRILAAQTLVLAGALLAFVLAALFAERRRSEAALKHSKERLELAFGAAKLGAFSLDLDTGRLECDARTAHIHGHESLPETIKEGRRFVHPDDRLCIDTTFAEAQRTAGVCSAEYRVVHPPGHVHAGEVHWVAFEGTIVRSTQGAPVRLLGVTRDITQRKQAEQALAERNTQLAFAGKIALVGSFAFDIASGRMQVSQGYAAIHGLREGTIETTRTDWRTRVHPDDLHRLDVHLQQATADRRREHYCEYRIVRSGGEIRWIESRSSISYDRDGAAQRIVGANIDVTERKQTEAVIEESEAHLADALAAGQVMAFEWDAVTRQSQRSDNAAHILGFQQGVAGARHNDFLRRVHPDDREAFKTHVRELCPDNPSYALNFRFCCSDSRQVWLEETARGEFDATGRLLRIKGLTRDITERKRAETHQGLLVAELDHRVKNVLAIVSVIASRTQDTNGSTADFVAALEGRIKSMATTHELLSCRRWQGIPLAELVQRELAPYATGSNLQIGGSDDILSAEAGQAVAMVFHELATNAAKFGALSTKGGHVSVRWSHRRNGHAQSWLSIRWEESGGPNVVPPARSGYGTSVIRDLIPYELGGTVELAHAPAGVRCRLEIPAHWLSSGNQPNDLSTGVSLPPQAERPTIST
jgi:PAS domain S-box-containing protein